MPPPTGRGWTSYSKNNNKKYVFHQFEHVDKFNLETQTPRRDASIPNVSTGLGQGAYLEGVWIIALEPSYGTVASLSPHTHLKQCIFLSDLSRTRPGSPVDCRAAPAEAPPIGKIHPFIKIPVLFEPLMRF